MAVRTALLNGNNINLDSDFSKYVESLTSQWVISWFDMTTTSVGVGKAFVQCTRASGETIMVYVENTESIAISGNWYIVIKVPQAMIDDWTNNPADWIGIATVELVETLPSANYMTLWQIVGGVLADVRYFIPKAQAFETNINSLLSRMDTAEESIEALELAWIPDHLEQSAMVWEKYTLSDILYLQRTPTLSNSLLEANVWDVAANTQLHIQRIWSWVETNQLKLYLKKYWDPTTGLTVEVRKWVKVSYSWTEDYWYWNQVICSWTISYSQFTTDLQEITVNMSWNFWWTRWELLDIVVYQTWSIVNSSNYYILGCDYTQWSEAFRYIAVNGSTRTPKYVMPYCVSDWFSNRLFVKKWAEYTATWYKSILFSWTQSWNKGSNSNNRSYFLFSQKKCTSIQFHCQLTAVWHSTYPCDWWIWTSSSTGQYLSWSYPGKSWTSNPTSWDKTITYDWNDVYWWMTGDHWYTQYQTLVFNYYVNAPKLIKYDKDTTPTEIKSEWEMLSNIFFWYDSNDDFLVGEETNTVTTWSITPWNFVWYVKIWNYKIPYYK